MIQICEIAAISGDGEMKSFFSEILDFITKSQFHQKIAAKI